MRIVIDMQGAQACNRRRGIGRYALALGKEMVRTRGEHTVILALNGLLQTSIEPIRAVFSDALPEENIRVWDGIGPVAAADPSNDSRRRVAEMTREAFLASFRPDVILHTSLFEGLGDDAVTSIGAFTNRTPSAVVLYDLIPLIHRKVYLERSVVEHWYLQKIDHLRRAALLLSISASSSQEAVEHLGFPASSVVNISTACDPRFRPTSVSAAAHSRLRGNHGLTRPFVMYTGGIDHRKNVEALVRAYAALPKKVRAGHQLAVVCSIEQSDRRRLERLAFECGLSRDEVVFTGFVSDDDLVALYNICKLFVFPSWHEGFGLPVLEAMACGRAVIGANTSSIPEVIGLEAALFNPYDDRSIADKLGQVLVDDDFRAELESHGLRRAKEFSWETTAMRAWDALSSSLVQRRRTAGRPAGAVRRPRLAYVSPLPPAQSGISDYSAELLPELATHYDIDVVVDQAEVSDCWIRANCRIRSVAWFRENYARFERTLYHFGNSAFHGHMFDLLRECPGIVVLHDSFLSGIVAHLDVHGGRLHTWAKALARAHGWTALRARYEAKDTADVVWAYPCNLDVLQQSIGVIVHSEYSRRLAEKWHGSGAADKWAVIPHLRIPSGAEAKAAARERLGISKSDFVVCSFGLIGPTKLSHRLIGAWLASGLGRDQRCRLIFVGKNHEGDYGVELTRTLRATTVPHRIEVTGWVEPDLYKEWLAAADVAVQLRTLSRGETSGAILDCMNYGLATIVNANGAMGDLPRRAVCMLPDEFSDMQLTEALTVLCRDERQRRELGRLAQEVIRQVHNPRNCGYQYFEAIEGFYWRAEEELYGLTKAIRRSEPSLTKNDLAGVAGAIAANHPAIPRRKQLLLDVSELVQRDARSGIQRVVRAILQELLSNPPDGWAVEPVYASADAGGYRYARQFISRFFGISDLWCDDEVVEAYPGDIFVGLDLQPSIVVAQEQHLLSWKTRGVKVVFVVYDLLPLLHSDAFPRGADKVHHDWLRTVSLFDGAICISKAVADELYEWLLVYGPKRHLPFSIEWFHLGADLESTVPTRGVPDDADRVLREVRRRPSFLMVGTLEPRKGHGLVLSAFEHLWREGLDLNLVIVGKQGWMVERLIDEVRGSAELGSRLFWLEGISDEYLDQVYAACTCVIAASVGEGFGLPLIEAAQRARPIIARDIPVFREVAGDHAFYFANEATPSVMAQAIQQWLSRYRSGSCPRSEAIERLTWKDSAQHLVRAVTMPGSGRNWIPDDVRRYWGNDFRLHTQVGERVGRVLRSKGEAGFLVFGPYMELSPNRYRIVLRGDATRWAGGEWIEVACEKGARRLASCDLSSETCGKWRCTLEIELASAVADLEVRVWVEAGSRMTVQGMEVSAVEDACEAEEGAAAVSISPQGERNQEPTSRGRGGRLLSA